MAFLFCLIAGPRYAADCLSEEKREGTLGLLFLTDLRGYDVIFGKLVSASMQTMPGLMAFFPVLSIALLLGGVTGGEFWRTSVVLINTLFLSLSLGLLVSSISREAHRALAAAILVLVVVAVTPLSANLLPNSRPIQPRLAAGFSPVESLRAATDVVYRGNPHRFWFSVALNQGLAWSFLALGSVMLPRSWQERASRMGQVDSRDIARTTERSARSLKLRRRLLEINPICWLASRNEAQRWLLFAFVATVALASATILLLGRIFGGSTLGVAPLLTFTLATVLKIWVAWQACATLAEARRNGSVELLMATPLSVDEIIRGHWQALQRFFFWPVVAALVMQAVPALEALARQPPSAGNLFWFPIPVLTLLGMATLVLDVLALGWVGMWMGLTQPKPIQAFARTILFAVIVPAVVFCLPNLIFDLFWISWARRKLQHGFRRAATERSTPAAAPLDWIKPMRQLAAPPIIVETAPSIDTRKQS
jgi:hypothetical protein